MEQGTITRKKLQNLVTEGQPKAVAKFSLGFTVNLGNYESCKIEAGMEVEGTVDNWPQLQKACQDEVEAIVQLQLEELRCKDSGVNVLGNRVR